MRYLEADRDWLRGQRFNGRKGVPAERLVKQIVEWMVTYTREEFTNPWTTVQAEADLELQGTLWNCWKWHWEEESKLFGQTPVDGAKVAERIQAGKGPVIRVGNGVVTQADLGGNVVLDMVFVAGLILGDPKVWTSFHARFPRGLDEFVPVPADPKGDEKSNASISKPKPSAPKDFEEWIRENGKLRSYSGRGSFDRWAGRILRRSKYQSSKEKTLLSLDGLKSDPRDEQSGINTEAHSGPEFEEDQRTQEQVETMVRECLATLSDKERLCLTVRIVEKRQNKELAQLLGNVADGTATRSLNKAKARVERCLKSRILLSSQAIQDWFSAKLHWP